MKGSDNMDRPDDEFEEDETRGDDEPKPRVNYEAKVQADIRAATQDEVSRALDEYLAKHDGEHPYPLKPIQTDGFTPLKKPWPPITGKVVEGQLQVDGPLIQGKGRSGLGAPYSPTGLALRDWFAGLAMQSLIIEVGHAGRVLDLAQPVEPAEMAVRAYRMADAMIRERGE